MDDIFFLSLVEVVDIHCNQIQRYGGHPGIRNNGLLAAAISGPKQTFGGRYLNSDLFEMAAAYIFYICQDHPFIDGNKRTALATGLVFLEVNGISIEDRQGILYMTIMKLASGQIGKLDIADTLRDLSV